MTSVQPTRITAPTGWIVEIQMVAMNVHVRKDTTLVWDMKMIVKVHTLYYKRISKQYSCMIDYTQISMNVCQIHVIQTLHVQMKMEASLVNVILDIWGMDQFVKVFSLMFTYYNKPPWL